MQMLVCFAFLITGVGRLDHREVLVFLHPGDLSAVNESASNGPASPDAKPKAPTNHIRQHLPVLPTPCEPSSTLLLWRNCCAAVEAHHDQEPSVRYPYELVEESFDREHTETLRLSSPPAAHLLHGKPSPPWSSLHSAKHRQRLGRIADCDVWCAGQHLKGTGWGVVTPSVW
jgi:hypothetical protein